MSVRASEPLLVVEDSDEDFYALQRAIRRVCDRPNIYRCTDGDQALDFIYGEGSYTAPLKRVPRPSAILLDLNLPGTDGRDVLNQLKQDNQYKEIPIVIFSTSSSPKDIDFCYKAGVNGYLVKPFDVEELQRLVQAFAHYWLDANTPPPSKLDRALFPPSP